MEPEYPKDMAANQGVGSEPQQTPEVEDVRESEAEYRSGQRFLWLMPLGLAAFLTIAALSLALY